MNKKELANPILVGIIYCIVGILFSFTLIVPMIHFLLAVIIESIVTYILPTLTNQMIGKIMIAILSIFLVTYLFFNTKSLLKKIRFSRYLTKTNVFTDLFLLHFIVHPLVFYCQWGLNQNFRGDGQLIFDVIKVDLYTNAFIFIYSIGLCCLQLFQLSHKIINKR